MLKALIILFCLYFTVDAQYLVNEDFEGSGIPSGWTNSGTINWDYTPALWNNQSAKFTDGGTIYINTPVFTAQDDIWISFQFEFSNAASTGETVLLYLRSGGSNTGWLSRRNTDQKLRLYHGTISSVVSTTSATANTHYYGWIHYIIGTGANGISQLYISTSAERPDTPEINTSNGNGTLQVDSIRFYDWTTIDNYVLDAVRISSSQIGDYVYEKVIAGFPGDPQYPIFPEN